MAYWDLPLRRGRIDRRRGLFAESEKASQLAPYVDKPILLLGAIVLMFAAGACGGVVASSCTECNLHSVQHEVVSVRWAFYEHLFFWVSVALAVAAVLTAEPVLAWLRK